MSAKFRRTHHAQINDHPLLRLDLQRWRPRLTLTLLFAGFTALSARAVYLQAWHDEFLTEEGEKRSQRVIPIPAYRGMITDRRGEPLAVSTPVESLWANPREADPTPQQIQALASILEKNPDQIRRLFADKSLRLRGTPGGAPQGPAGQKPENRRSVRQAGIPTLLPRRRSCRPRVGHHQHRGPGPGRPGTGLPDLAHRRSRGRAGHQGPAR